MKDEKALSSKAHVPMTRSYGRLMHIEPAELGLCKCKRGPLGLTLGRR